MHSIKKGIAASVLVSGIMLGALTSIAFASSYSISGSSSISGTTVTLSGTASASPFVGQSTDQHIAVDWTGACSSASATAFQFDSISFSDTQNGTFTNATWHTSHNYGVPGTYSACVKVYHANFNGNEGSEASTFTASIVIPPTNTLPTANNLSVATNENAATSSSVVATDTDGDTLKYILVNGPSHGTLNLDTNTGSFTYTPNANYTGPDSFTYKANDGVGDSNTATVSITVNAVSPVIGVLEVKKIIVGGPSINADNFSFKVTGSTDGTGSPLPFDPSGTSDMGVGIAQTYSVAEVASSTYTTTYANSENANADCSGLSIAANATTTCTITNTYNASGNSIPVANDLSITTSENTATSSRVTATDADNDPLTYGVATAPTFGSVAFNSDGTFTYTPNSGYNGSDSFTFDANDGTASSSPATVSITVNAAGGGPAHTASSQTITVQQAGLDAGPVLAALADNSGKWFMYNDTNDTIDNTLGSFVWGPSAAPAGSGSIEFAVGNSPLDRKNIATYLFAGTPISDITGLLFSTYSHSGTASSSSEDPFLNFNIDFSGTDAWQGRLVYVPSVNGTVATDTWQTWDAIDSANALWTWSHFASNGNKWPDGNTSQYRTWDDITGSFPQASILASDGWLGIRVGEPGPTGYTADVDKFVITLDNGSNATTTTFDFEPTDPTCASNQSLVNHVCVTNGSGNGNGNGGGGGGGGGGGVIGGPLSFGFSNGGVVLGTSTEAAPDCSQYLTAYIRQGKQNDSSQVERLQNFLNDLEGDTLTVNGIYDSATLGAVNAFQTKYGNDILAPWGATGPTGYVYYTTQKEINTIYCHFTKQFPLTEDQLSEIARIRALGEVYNPGVVLGASTNVPAQNKNNGTSTAVSLAIESTSTASTSGATSQQGGFWSKVWHFIFR